MNERDRAMWRQYAAPHSGRQIEADLLLDVEAKKVARILLPQDEILASLPDPTSKQDRGVATYSHTSRYMQRYSQEVQNQFFSKVWGSGGVDVPNGEELAKFLTKVNNIPWVNPSEEVTEAELQPTINRVLEGFMLPHLPVVIIKDDFTMALEIFGGGEEEDSYEKAYKKTFKDLLSTADHSKGTGVRFSYSKIWDTTWIAASQRSTLTDPKNADMVDKFTTQLFSNGRIATDPGEEERSFLYFGMWNASTEIAAASAWIMLQEEMSNQGYNKGNPFLELARIYQKGYVPLGTLIEEHDGQQFQMFGVFQPPIIHQ